MTKALDHLLLPLHHRLAREAGRKREPEIDDGLKHFLNQPSAIEFLDVLIIDVTSKLPEPTITWLDAFRHKYCIASTVNDEKVLLSLKQNILVLLTLQMAKQIEPLETLVKIGEFICIDGSISRMGGIIEGIYACPELSALNTYCAVEARKLVDKAQIYEGNEQHIPTGLKYLLGFLSMDQAVLKDPSFRSGLEQVSPAEIFRIREHFYPYLHAHIKEEMRSKLQGIILLSQDKDLQSYNEEVERFDSIFSDTSASTFLLFSDDNNCTIDTEELERFCVLHYPLPSTGEGADNTLFVPYDVLIEMTDEQLKMLSGIELESSLHILQQTGDPSIGGYHLVLQEKIVEILGPSKGRPPIRLPLPLSLIDSVRYGAPLQDIQVLAQTEKCVIPDEKIEEMASFLRALTVRKNGHQIYSMLAYEISAEGRVRADAELLSATIMYNHPDLFDAIINKPGFNFQSLCQLSFFFRFTPFSVCTPLVMAIQCDTPMLDTLLEALLKPAFLGHEIDHFTGYLRRLRGDHNNIALLWLEAINAISNSDQKFSMENEADWNHLLTEAISQKYDGNKNKFHAFLLEAHQRLGPLYQLAYQSPMGAILNAPKIITPFMAADMHELIHWTQLNQLYQLPPLHVALHSNKFHILEKLVESGVSTRLQSSDGDTIFHLLFRSDHTDLTQRLLDKITDHFALDIANGKGISARHQAILSGNLTMVQYLNEHGLLQLPGHEAILNVAVESGHKTIVNYLLRHGYGDQINGRSLISGLRPLNVTMNNNNFDMVEYLVQAGADPTIRDAQENTVLDQLYDLYNDNNADDTVKEAVSECFQFILDTGKVDVNQFKYKNRHYLLEQAVLDDNEEMMNMLLSNNADIYQRMTTDGANQQYIFDYILQRIPDEASKIILSAALKSAVIRHEEPQFCDRIQVLLENGADPLLDMGGEFTALQYSIAACEMDENVRDKILASALKIALRKEVEMEVRGEVEINTFITQISGGDPDFIPKDVQIEIIISIIECMSHTDPDQLNHAALTVLYAFILRVQVKQHDIEGINDILEKGADPLLAIHPDRCEASSYWPCALDIALACDSDNPEVLEALLENIRQDTLRGETKINDAMDEGCSRMYYAMKHNQPPKILELLRECNAQLNPEELESYKAFQDIAYMLHAPADKTREHLRENSGAHKKPRRNLEPAELIEITDQLVGIYQWNIQALKTRLGCNPDSTLTPAEMEQIQKNPVSIETLREEIDALRDERHITPPDVLLSDVDGRRMSENNTKCPI